MWELSASQSENLRVFVTPFTLSSNNLEMDAQCELDFKLVSFFFESFPRLNFCAFSILN